MAIPAYQRPTGWDDAHPIGTGALADYLGAYAQAAAGQARSDALTALAAISLTPGPSGQDGVSPTITGGTVSTLAPGQAASATLVSTGAHSYRLDLGIPQGATGAGGSAGAVPTIAVGNVGGLAAGSTPTAALRSTGANAYALDLGIPAGAAGAGGTHGDKGDKGDKGDTGNTGNTGPAAALTAGTTTTGAAGSSASVTITGTAPNQTISFTIPRGADGAPGSNGPANTLAIGTVSTAAAGAPAAAQITGTAPNQTLSLTLPRGADGVAGPPNSLTAGPVTTGAPGSSASATITGIAPNQTLTLSIPRGDTGATPTLPDATTTVKGVGYKGASGGFADYDATQTALAAKAPVASPALVGIPTAPTAPAGTNSTQLATTAHVKTAIDNLVAGAPGALDTLKEIADQLANDESAVSALTTVVGTKAPASTTVVDLPDRTNETTETVPVGATTNCSTNGVVKTAPALSSTTPPQRFGVKSNATLTSGAVFTVSLPDFTGAVVTVTMIPGEKRTFRQFGTLGWVVESGAIPLPTLDGRYASSTDPRLSDTRTPSASSVTYPTVASSLKPSATAADTDEALRALGLTSGKALPGVLRGAANGVASLDANTRVPVAQLGSGTPSVSTVLRGDGSWGASPGGSASTFRATTADMSMTNSTTLVDVTGLLIPIAGNSTEVWTFDLMLLMLNDNAAMGTKLGWTYPSGTTIYNAGVTQGGGSNAWSQSTNTNPLRRESFVHAISGTDFSYGSDPQGIYLTGIVRSGATAGNVQLQWAQNTANASTARLMRGSMLRLTKVTT